MLIFGQTLKRLRVWPISNLAKPVMLAKPVAAPNSRSSCISSSRKWCSKPHQKKMRMHLEAHNFITMTACFLLAPSILIILFILAPHSCKPLSILFAITSASAANFLHLCILLLLLHHLQPPLQYPLHVIHTPQSYLGSSA